MLEKIKRFFCASAEPELSLDQKTERRYLLYFSGFWFLLWSFAPMIALNNDFVDILENIVWGRHFQFGYDKNPYLGAWIGHASYVLTGNDTWISYILSQFFVISGFLAIYCLARQMLSGTASILSAVFLWGITFYGMKAAELCDDVMELGFWPVLIFCFYMALRSNRKVFYWIMTGILVGLTFMVKYYGAVLFASMLVVLLATPEGRSSFRGVGIYLACLLAFLIVLPNMLWLLNNEFVAVDYALGRASLNSGAETYDYMRHLAYPWKAVERILGVIAVPFGVFALFFFKSKKEKLPDAFNRRFILILGFGPFALTLLFSFVTGGSINYSWVLPCFSLTGIFAFLFWNPVISSFRFKAFVSVMALIGVIFAVIFVVRSTYHQGYVKRGCDYENFPGRAAGAFLTETWRNQFGTALPYVIGNREEACNLAVYSKDQPTAYFSANPLFSQWIDENDIRKKGAVVIYRDKAQKPEWLTRLNSDFRMTEGREISFPRAVPPWFVRLMGKQPKPILLKYHIIRPEDAVK